MNIILDACAVIAYLRDEEGGDVVENFLIDSEYSCYIHAILTSDHHEFDRIVPLEICPITFIR